MKNSTLKNRLLSIISLLMITSPFFAQNLLTNGDFGATAAPFGWTKNNSDILLNEKNAYSIHPEMDENGAYINGNCRMPGLGAARWITQGVTISAAGTYTFKFTGRIQNAANFQSGESENNHATLGVATLKGEIFPFEADGTTVGTTAIATISTQSNSNAELSTEVVIGSDVTKVQVKISKDWNVPYLDDVYFGLPTTGLNDLQINNLIVNSVNGIIEVNSQNTLECVKILDMTGRMIQSINTINQPKIQFSQPVEKGLYLIVASDNQGRTGVVKHFIK